MYYVLADQMTGELLQVSTEPLIAEEGQILKLRQGDIPDLNKFEWVNSALCFMEKQNTRILSQEAFVTRLTDQEMMTIYSIAKTNVMIEVWLDRFKMAQEINLDYPFMQEGIRGLEQAGILAPGRAEELLS